MLCQAKRKEIFLPHHKSCKKRLKTSANQRIRNNAVKTAIRRTLKDARSLLAKGESIDLNKCYTEIDKAAGKGVFHKNTASRLKSRLAKSMARSVAGSA